MKKAALGLIGLGLVVFMMGAPKVGIVLIVLALVLFSIGEAQADKSKGGGDD